MWKWLKVIFWLIIFIILILILVIAGIVLFVDPNRFKPLIIEKVAQYTGRTLTLEDKLSWSVFPTLRLSIGHATLSNPAGFTAPTFLSVEQASFSLAVVPLLSKKIEIHEIHLQGLHLSLVKNAKGEGNWQLAPAAVSEPVAATSVTPEKSKSQKTTLPELIIPQLDISSATIDYTDEIERRAVTLSQGFITLKDFAFGKTFPFDAQFDFSDTATHTAGHLSVHTQALIDPNSSHYELDAIDLATNIDSDLLQQKKLSFVLDGKIQIQSTDPLQASFQLHSKNIALSNKKVASASKQSSAKATQSNSSISKESAPEQTIVLPAMLKNLSIEGEWIIDQFFYDPLKIANIHLSLAAKEGIIDMPLKADIYQGTLTSDFKLDATRSAVQTKTQLKSLQLQPLFTDLFSKDNTSGEMNLNATLSTDIKRTSEIMTHLMGDVQFSLSNVVIHGFDAAHYVQTTRALAAGKGPSKQTGANETVLGHLSGSAHIDQGIANNPDLLVENPAFTVKGNGLLNLVSQTFDHYRINFIQPQGSVAFILTGPFANPHVQLDIHELLESAAKKEITNRLKSALNGNRGDGDSAFIIRL